MDVIQMTVMTLNRYLPRSLLSSATQPAITCSKLTIETLEQGHSGVFIVNSEHISHLVLMLLLLTLSR